VSPGNAWHSYTEERTWQLYSLGGFVRPGGLADAQSFGAKAPFLWRFGAALKGRSSTVVTVVRGGAKEIASPFPVQVHDQR